jgi:hypothetical protein
VKLEQLRAGPVETNIVASLVRFGVPDTQKATVDILESLTEEYARLNASNYLCSIEQLDKAVGYIDNTYHARQVTFIGFCTLTPFFILSSFGTPKVIMKLLRKSIKLFVNWQQS